MDNTNSTPETPDSQIPDSPIFAGFIPPVDNYSKLPHQFIDLLPRFETISELKVTLYILRHTWGYNDPEKKLTIDEFMHGRKNRKGNRMDNGVGLSKPSVIDGLRRAEDHGFIMVETDDSDKARIEKFYALSVVSEDQMSKLFTSGVKNLYIGGKKSLQRSEKDTKKRNSKKKPVPSGTQSHERDFIFEAVAAVCFDLHSSDEINGAGGRVAKISTWVKQTYPGATAKTIAAFGIHYDANNQGASRPRDLDKFKEHFVKFHSFSLERQKLASKAQPFNVLALTQIQDGE